MLSQDTSTNGDCIYLSLTYNECVTYVKNIVATISHSDLSKYWIVFDIDQTLLTDEKFKHLYRSRNDIFRFQHRGNHDPILPMVDLYNWCSSQGLKMCIITGRNDSIQKVTQENLYRVGIRKCHRFYTKRGKENTMSYKSRCRKEIIDTGGIILANIGDQDTDLLISENPRIYGYSRYAIKLPSTY